MKIQNVDKLVKKSNQLRNKVDKNSHSSDLHEAFVENV